MAGRCDGGCDLACRSEDSSVNNQSGSPSLHWALEFSQELSTLPPSGLLAVRGSWGVDRPVFNTLSCRVSSQGPGSEVVNATPLS